MGNVTKLHNANFNALQKKEVAYSKATRILNSQISALERITADDIKSCDVVRNTEGLYATKKSQEDFVIANRQVAELNASIAKTVEDAVAILVEPTLLPQDTN